MEKTIPNDLKNQGITSRIRRIFFRNGIKNKSGPTISNTQQQNEKVPPKNDTTTIPEDLQYAYEKYNALVDDIQNLQQQAMLKLEKLGLGKYAKDLFSSLCKEK